MFRPTQAVMSKASRLPLTSKGGNKEYYKGTGSFPGLGPKRQGRHGIRSKAPYILMPERMRTFVVPEGLNECKLGPFVSRMVKIDTKDNVWPVADTKPVVDEDGNDWVSKRGGLFGPRGFDGAYYIQLADHFKAQKQ